MLCSLWLFYQAFISFFLLLRLLLRTYKLLKNKSAEANATKAGLTLPMLTDNEEAFIQYWQQYRGRQKKLFYQLMVGLPLGLLLGGVIAFNFYSGWYKRADFMANAKFNPLVLVVALLIIAVFVAVFSKKFQWEQREQKYRELLAKKEKLQKDITKTENQ